jgi:uncharacterized protein (TIGR03083 family)
MDAEVTWRLIDRERADLADFLETLTADEWTTSSLCGGWTVRDVGVHLTQSAARWPRMAREAVRSGFRFNAMLQRAAREDTSTPEEVVATLRALVGVRRRPPGTAVADPLMDLLVHGQDIARPLGRARSMPTDAALVAGERVWAMGFPFHARKRFRGLAFTAVDAPFAVGAGQAVSGPMSDVLLVLAGRSEGLAGLSGDTAAVARALDGGR